LNYMLFIGPAKFTEMYNFEHKDAIIK